MDISIVSAISLLLTGAILYLCCFTSTFSNLGGAAHSFADEYNKVYCDSDEDDEPVGKEADKETKSPAKATSKRSRTRKAD